jgi:hypothetical protein
MAYCTLAQLKDYEGIPTATTKDDARLQTFLDGAQRAIEVETGRIFEATVDSTRYLDCISHENGGPIDGALLLLDRDFCAITSIINGDGATVTSGQYTTVPRNDTPYYAIRLRGSSGLSWTFTTDPEGAISVTGKQAYSLTAPTDIVLACKRWASWLYRQKDSQGQFDRPTTSPDGLLMLPATIPPDVIALLSPYKKRL